MKSTTKMGMAVFIILVVIAGIYLFSGTGEKGTISTATTTTATTTKETQIVGNKTVAVSVGNTGKGTGTVVQTAQPSAVNYVMPDLNRPIQVLAPLSAAQSQTLFNQITDETRALKANANNADGWDTLGALRRAIGDRDGAKEIWTYVTLKWPTLSVPWQNLGELYRYDYKDLVKAESAYLQAIKINSASVDSYAALNEIYQGENAPDKAIAILTKGVNANPTSNMLLLDLARLLVAQGQKDQAKTYYQKAYDLVTKANDTSGADAIRQEMDAL